MISALQFETMKRDKEESRKAVIEKKKLDEIAAVENKPKLTMQLLELLKWGQNTFNGRCIDGIEIYCGLKFDHQYNDWKICICQYLARNTVLSIHILDSGTFVLNYENKCQFLSVTKLDEVSKCICEKLISFKADQLLLLKHNCE